MENHSSNEHDTNEFAHKHNREEKPDAGRCLHLWVMMMVHKWKICLIAFQLLDVHVHGREGFLKAEWTVMANAEMGMQARMSKRKRLSQRNFPFDKWKKKIITVKATRPQLWLCQHSVDASSRAIYLQSWLCLHQSTLPSHPQPSMHPFSGIHTRFRQPKPFPPHKSLLACSGIQLLLVLLLWLWKMEGVGGEALIICLNNTGNSC